MENQRPLIYEVPHKAIRNALSRFSLLAGSTDYNDKTELDKLNEIAEDVFRILDSHARHENNVLLNHLEKKVSGSSVHDIEDHERIESEMQKLKEALNELYKRAGKGEDLRYPGNDFYIQLSDFHAQYLQHMLEEERETQALMWKNFTDEELLKMDTEIRSNIPPDDMLLMAKYMFPAFSNKSRIEMLNSIKAAAPPQFFDAVLKTAESVLAQDDFNRIKKEL